MTTLRPSGAVVLVAAIALALPRSGHAVPAFARQTGNSCSTCHYQHFPTLTAYGQSFKSTNYAQLGGQGMVEGAFLSLPSVLNLSMVFKAMYVTTPEQDDLRFPDEAAFFAGGRVGKNIGFLLEGQLSDQSAPLLASFKMPIGVEVAGGTLSLIPFTTDGLGTAFGFELLNTGAVRNVRIFEERAAISAQQYVVGGEGEGVAEGIALVLATRHGFINFTSWTPHHGPVALRGGTYYMRAVVTPMVAGWQLGGGVQWWGGQVGRVDRVANAWALDLQAQGMALNLPLGVYASYARAPGTAPGAASSDTNLFNRAPTAQWAFAAAAELGLLPQRLMVGAGFRLGETGVVANGEDRATTLSTTFLLRQNLALHLSHTLYGGTRWSGRTDDRKSSLTLFTAF